MTISDELAKSESYCLICKTKTPNTEPAYLAKTRNKRIGLHSTCTSCGKGKFLFIANKKVCKFPKDVRKALQKLEPEESYEGGILPLLPLLGLIAAGVTAASGVAGTVANTVIQSKKAEEEKRHNEEIEKAVKGQGLSNRASKKKDIKHKLEKSIALLEKHGAKVTLDLSDSETD
jgi:hypothetical protein